MTQFSLPVGVTSSIELITPDMARYWIKEKNRDNRPMRPNFIHYLARQLKAGNFHLTTDGIGFDKDGFLTNGQHRLMAIIEADIAARMLVLRGVTPDANLVTDRGVSRTLADVLALPNTLIADANLLGAITLPVQRNRLSEHQVGEIAMWWGAAHDALLRAASRRFTRDLSSASFRVGAGVRWIAERAPDRRQYVLDQFRVIMSNNTPKMSRAAATLWKRWVRDKIGRGTLARKISGASVAYYHLDPTRAESAPAMRDPAETLAEFKHDCAFIEWAFQMTPAGSVNPYAAFHNPKRSTVAPFADRSQLERSGSIGP